MSTFESSIREIPYAQTVVYGMLCDLSHLEKLKDRIPADQLEQFSFDAGSITINAAPVGEIKLRIIGKEKPKCIKFETEKSPVPFNFWIQILPVTDTSCKMKLTIKAELNPFIKGIVKKPLSEGIEKLADLLQNIRYEQTVSKGCHPEVP